ncbi:PSCA protein, partial [Sylvia atricapilla]|nr:PSCA protein [Sylvia atricapilla]
GSSLQCYSCSPQISNSKCMKKEDCGTKTACKTEVIRLAGLFSIISKGCDSSCADSYSDFNVGNRNISCCTTDLCNVNAAGSVRSSYGLAGGIAAGVLWVTLSNK